ncbi:MAG: hypothetical protein ABSC56_10820 [Solirubrobacteraceae bacterium]
MLYCVVPREFDGALLERLRAHYADEPEMSVIVDRRVSERRRRARHPIAAEQRKQRDRRRRRVCGEMPALYGERASAA